MKKSIIALALVTAGLQFKAQETDTWRWGIQLGAQGNKSEYAGGSSNAHARFNQNEFGSGAIDFIGRYDFNNHWKIETGLGFSAIGFEYALAENYSLINPMNRFSSIRSSAGTFQIPMMVSYKFTPNCKNWKWFISGGFASVFQGASTNFSEFTKTNDGPSNIIYLNQTTEVKGGANVHLRFSAGREKVFQSGRIFSWAFIWNAGFTEMAKSTVKYTIDNQLYEHQFSNNGNYFGFRLAYFFKPLNKVPETKAK